VPQASAPISREPHWFAEWDNSHRKAGMTLRILFQIAAWLCIVAIGVLSLVASPLRPVTVVPHALEHAAIFVAAGFAAALGYPGRTALTMAALVLFSGAVEVAQLFAPGRHATLGDFIVDAGAACIGVVLASLTMRLWMQRT
jgi:VanZ family protein